jgi:hypothetical protein
VTPLFDLYERAYRVLPWPLAAIPTAVRVVFVAYLVLIGAGLALYIAVGLLHR